MEQRPEWRYALHVSPTAVTVAAERICCMPDESEVPVGCLPRTRHRAGISACCHTRQSPPSYLNARDGIQIEKMLFIFYFKVAESVFEFVLFRIRY